MGVWGLVKKNRAFALFIIIIVLFSLFSVIIGERYYSFENIGIILLNMSAEGFILVAICLLLLLGEIDLSLGSIMVLGAILSGKFILTFHIHFIPAIFMAVAICMLCGVINGLIVSVLKVAAFIGTLATSMIYMGLAIILASTGLSDFQSPGFTYLGQAKIFGVIQLPVLYAIVLFMIFAYLTHYNKFFSGFYFIGGNERAAEYSGINTKKAKIIAFMIAAMLAAFSGVISAMRFNASITSIGAGVELRAVTAAVIGGVSFTGGKGTILGATMGALLIACLNNILTMMMISPELQYVATGVVLVLAILLDSMINKPAIKS